MAFVLADLKCVDPHNPRRVFVYKTDDTTATVVASAYFDAAAVPAGNPHLRKGDMILASTDEDGTEGMTSIVVTSADEATPVTVVKTA